MARSHTGRRRRPARPSSSWTRRWFELVWLKGVADKSRRGRIRRNNNKCCFCVRLPLSVSSATPSTPEVPTRRREAYRASPGTICASIIRASLRSESLMTSRPWAARCDASTSSQRSRRRLRLRRSAERGCGAGRRERLLLEGRLPESIGVFGRWFAALPGCPGRSSST